MMNLMQIGKAQNKLRVTSCELRVYPWFVVCFLFLINNTFANDSIIFQQKNTLLITENHQPFIKDSIVIQQASKYVTTDKLGQIYIVNANDELIKYNAQGQEQFVYFDRTLGEISLIDATNPFQILVFFEGFQMVVWLDRTLNPISKTSFSDFGFFQINTLSVASDNRIWIYDNTTFQIKKVDNQGNVITESLELNNITNNLYPNFIIEKNNRIYLNNPETGILVFDNFGQHIETIPITNLTNFQIIDNQLWYQWKSEFRSYHFKTLETQTIDLPFQVETNQAIFKQKNNWYWVKLEEILIFKLKN
ncbi:MAG: hypothetical protein AB8G11_21765 [Saprospiraceae bacterium]